MKTIDTTNEPNNNSISTLAYLLWEKAGCPHGRDLEFWMRAEKQLLGAHQPAAAEPNAAKPRSRSQLSSMPIKSRKKSGRF